MTPLASVLCLALLLCAAASGADSDSSSVAQIRDTLKNLHTSIRDAGLKANNFFSERQQWCDIAAEESAKRDEEARATLRHLNTDLQDHEASVDETQGVIQHLKNDIAAAKLLVNQTEKVLSVWRNDQSTVGSESLALEKKEHVLKTMVQNRQETLASLKSELDLVQPNLAQMASRAAETKRRLLDREHSEDSLHKFNQALTAACLQGAQHSDGSDRERTSVETSVDTALKALDLVDNAPNHPTAMKTLEEVGSAQSDVVSFVQVDAQEDLFSIFGGETQAQAIDTPAPTLDAGAQEHTPSLAHKTETAKTVRPQIQKLLSELKEKTVSVDTAQKEWCTSEKAHNSIVLSLAQAEVSKTSADINAHADAESILVAASKQLAEDMVKVNSTANDMLRGVAKEKAMIKTNAKDQKLATRILAQAIAILTDLQSSDLPGKSAKGAEKAVIALKTAKAGLQKQTKDSIRSRKQLDDTIEAVASVAKESVSVLQQERMNIDMARDNHASERERCADNNRGFSDEVGEATVYLKKLEDECQPDLVAMKQKERKTEISALSDAEKVLDGQVIRSSHPTRNAHDSNGLRGAKTTRSLSPMERAAQEIGVAVDGSD